MIVLDASALLAYLFGESGHEVVASKLDSCCISSVNMSEVLARFARDGHDPCRVAGRLAATAMEIVPFDLVQATTAAALVASTRHLGLSLGDRACLALAVVRELEVLTADRAWAQLELPIRIRVVR